MIESLGERLFRMRWMLGAAAAGIAVSALFAEPYWFVPVVAMACIVAVAVIAPPGPAERLVDLAQDGGTGEVDALSAISLAAAVPDPVVIFDGRGTVAHANAAAQSVFAGLATGISLQLKFRSPEMQAFIADVLSRQSTVEPVDYAERVPVERLFRVTATPVGGGSDLFVMVFKDQSEARRIDRMRADFIANASHELRTPLASIAGFVETLRGPAKNDEVAREQFLQIMQNQTARMARLIDDLLSLSRLEMKSYLKPGATVDVGLTVEGVIDSLGPLARDSGVTVEKHIPQSGLRVAGDRDELFQVFENLLENAIKYGQSGGRVIVSIEGAPSGEIAVAFRDFGPGIPEEHIPRVTERFYRVDVETSRAQKGTGLGLAIVKHILTRHNARLSIRSEVGQGATFTVHFPPA